MRLTLYTEYSLRVLTHLGLYPDRRCSISEIAKAFVVSENHLTKVVHALGRDGFIDTVRGRGGGLRLARPAEDIRLGDVVRRTEGVLNSADCSRCPLVSSCLLIGVLEKAMAAFLAVLDNYTVADLLTPGDRLRSLLGVVPIAATPDLLAE